jgi:hypothetical protein
MDPFRTWPLSKQYLAGHFYLSEEKPISISEAQRAQLGALHLFISFGKYSPSISVADLQLCSPAERKKRIDEWKKLSCLSKSAAMQMFLDLMSSLFPNWTRSRKLLYEFQIEYRNMLPTDVKDEKKLAEDKISLERKAFKRTVGRSMVSKSMMTQFDEPGELRPDLQQLKVPKKRMKRSRFNRAQSIDIENSVYSFMDCGEEKIASNESAIMSSIEAYRKSMGQGNHLKNFIENLQSYKGGNIKDTSATKLPNTQAVVECEVMEIDPPVDFNKELKQYRRSLLQKEINKVTGSEPMNLNAGLEKISEKISSLKIVLQKLHNT